MTPTTPAGRQREWPSLPPVPPSSFCRWHRCTSPEHSGQSDPSGERLSLPNIPSRTLGDPAALGVRGGVGRRAPVPHPRQRRQIRRHFTRRRRSPRSAAGGAAPGSRPAARPARHKAVANAPEVPRGDRRAECQAVRPSRVMASRTASRSAPRETASSAAALSAVPSSQRCPRAYECTCPGQQARSSRSA